MKFFESIEQHLDGMNLNIVITKTPDGLTVSVLPQLTCKDETKKNIIPLMIKGTAEQLDEQFAVKIQEPLSEVSGFSTNLIEFEKAQEIAKEKSAITKAEKDEKVKMIKKADTCITKAEEFIEKDDIKKAILQIEAALKFSPEHKKANEMLKKHKPGAIGMFEEVVEVVEEPATVVINEPALPPVQDEPQVPMEPTSMKEVGMEEQQKQETISPEKQEKVLANLAEEEALATESINHENNAAIEPTIDETKVNYTKVDITGKPSRQDFEPQENYEGRLAEFEAESPTIQAENPKATIPSDSPIEEKKSEMQEMTEQETADKEMEAMLENISVEIKVEPKEETPKAASDDKYEILG